MASLRDLCDFSAICGLRFCLSVPTQRIYGAHTSSLIMTLKSNRVRFIDSIHLEKAPTSRCDSPKRTTQRTSPQNIARTNPRTIRNHELLFAILAIPLRSLRFKISLVRPNATGPWHPRKPPLSHGTTSYSLVTMPLAYCRVPK